LFGTCGARCFTAAGKIRHEEMKEKKRKKEKFWGLKLAAVHVLVTIDMNTSMTSHPSNMQCM
jgi:hypothetical protein